MSIATQHVTAWFVLALFVAAGAGLGLARLIQFVVTRKGR